VAIENVNSPSGEEADDVAGMLGGAADSAPV
jgi:hypothetical protein